MRDETEIPPGVRRCNGCRRHRFIAIRARVGRWRELADLRRHRPAWIRQWELVAIAHESGLDELRAILGNAIALKAYREKVLPFPDGAILAKMAWKYVPSTEFKSAFVPGPATTVQIMVKDSRKYAATGGWGFGRFIDGKPVDE